MREAARRLLARESTLDACYSSNDGMVLGGYFHCLSHGIEVSNQLAIFSHNGLDMARFIDLGFELPEGGTT